MKKNLLIFLGGLACLFLLGCGTKTVPSTTIDTGALFSGEDELTGAIAITGSSLREELTGFETKGSITIVTGAENTGNTASVTTSSSVSNDIKALIQQRSTKPKEQTKLTEDDIDLIDKVINSLLKN